MILKHDKQWQKQFKDQATWCTKNNLLQLSHFQFVNVLLVPHYI